MKFSDIYHANQTAITFELFPPRSEKGMAVLEERLPDLISLQPSLITVTYGALGSAPGETLQICSRLKNEYHVETAHHLTCVGANQVEITAILETMRQHNIENIVALRGDPPQGDIEFIPPTNGYNHGNQLVEHIHAIGGFSIAVAGYPEKHTEAPNFEADLQNLKLKVDSGADAIITQLFYDNNVFYRFLEQCRTLGIDKPIVPGLMPILGLNQIKRIADKCGATIPEHLLAQLKQAGDNAEKIWEISVTHTANQALDLLQHGVPGIHFYVLNSDYHIAEIIRRIRPILHRYAT
jgi:methylenetetrahydrofolate reductase (NADPH)